MNRPDPTPAERYLIVNADDFGLSAGVNRGIIHAHEHGILTSASLMVNWPAAAEAADYARKHPGLSIGLHVDLAEWVYRDYQWVPRYQIVPTNDERAVAQEAERQLEKFRSLLGKDPTHIDSHQHVHRQEPVLSVLRERARQLSVPLRSFSSQVQYCGDFYGQTGEGDPWPEGISVEGLLATLSSLAPGLSELGCHPGDDEHLDSVYRLERMEEVKTLCDPHIRDALDTLNIRLCSFAKLPSAAPDPEL
jgi:predicted glycoside hydrolase/deacetylase ChbG (UPF0249 family)